MDPLSFTASLLTVIGTAGLIGNGLKRVVALKRAPAILLDLNDEVAGLYCVLQAVDFLIRKHTNIAHNAPMSSVCRSLEKSETTLFKLEDLLRDKLTIETRDGEMRLDRRAWLFAESKVRNLKEQIRADRIELSSALSLLASSASLGVELQLQQLSFTVQTLGESVHLIEKLSNQVQDLLVLQRHAHDVVDRGGNSVQGGKDSDVAEEEDERPEGPLEEFDKALVESQSVKSEPRQYDRQVSDVSGLSLASLRNLSRQSTLVEDHGMEISERPNKARSFPTKLSQTSCNLDCGCICHKRNRLKSPAVLSTALGSLFVGYKASPWSSQNCDKKYCRSSTTKITYAFPQWLLRRVISVSMAYSHPQGPNFCLRMIRVRPGNANIFTAVFRGTCNHVQRLLCDEEASVLDVDPSHNTALQWAVRRMDIPTIELLINEGSDIFYENSSGSFPYLVAWEKILGEPHRWNNQDLEDLELLFSDRSGLAHFHFSELHRACLGLSGKTLQDVVLYTGKSGIDVIDNTGRTTLSWAARRGDDVAVKLLLERGANPSRPDQSMKTPLHWSIGGECILLLLQYDAEVYAKDDDGRTALNYVASNRDDATFVDTLVKFNADIESEDNEGWRPLHWAAHKNQPATLDRLLYHGADKNATDKLGRSPLHLAILRNCHEVLKILVEVVANGERSKTALGSTVLHCAADHADIQTLHILRSANLSNVKIEEENKDGFTAQKIAEFRRDCNEEWAYSSCQASDPDPKEWYIAFRTFIAGVHPIERLGDGK